MASKDSSKANVPSYKRTVILFVDPTLLSDQHIGRLQSDLEILALNLMIFFEAKECMDHLHQLHHQSILLIVGESNGEKIARAALSSTKLHGLYIVCSNPSQRPPWTSSLGPSVRCFLVDAASLSYRMRMAESDDRHNGVSFDVLSSSSKPQSESRNSQEATFLYGQLLKHVLTQMSYTEDDMDNLIKFFEKKSTNQQITEEFRRQYTPNKALPYYASELFFYSTLNNALRTCEFTVIYTMGIFIKDLHAALVQLHKPISGDEVLELYRGQVIQRKDFERIQQNTGGLLSINQFLSTSTAKDVAESFALGAQDGQTGVLFHITVTEVMSRTVCYANIKEYSKFKDEDEHLFTMGSVFRINFVQYLNETNIWCVDLTLTSDQDEEIAALIDSYRKEIEPPNLFSLCSILLNMQQFDQMGAICEIGLKSATNANDLFNLHLYSGVANCIFGNGSKVKEHFKMADTYIEDILNDDQTKYEKLLINATSALFQGEFGRVLEIMKMVREEQQQNPQNPMNGEILTRFFYRSGLIAEHQGDVAEAKSNYSKAYEKMRDVLPSLHKDVIGCRQMLNQLEIDSDQPEGISSAFAFLQGTFGKTLLPDHPRK